MEMTAETRQEIRWHRLKPLARRDADRKTFIKAIERLDRIAVGGELLKQTKNILAAQRKKPAKSHRDPALIAKSIAQVYALYEARLINTQQYFYLAVWYADLLHDERVISGKYESELSPISEAIEKIESDNGLKNGEFWLKGEGPKEYELLNNTYNSILDQKFIEVLREVGLIEIAYMKEHDPVELARLCERGRRSFYDRDEYTAVLRDVVIRYEKDAQRAAAAKAYTATVTLLGAGAEGLLLLRCLQAKLKASQYANKLSKRKRPQFPDDPTTWTFEQLIEVCEHAKWLVPVETKIAKYSTAGLTHVLRRMRNQVHPGKLAHMSPWLETDERDYADAEAIYHVVLSTVKIRKR